MRRWFGSKPGGRLHLSHPVVTAAGAGYDLIRLAIATSAGATSVAARPWSDNAHVPAAAPVIRSISCPRLVAIDAAREKLHERTDQIDADAHRELGEELDLEEQQIRHAFGKY